nr:hypothetical protein [Tanacetum cinerariifolium]
SPKTPENSDDEGNGEENLGTNVGREEGHDEKEEEDELYRDVNINLGRGIQTTQEFKDSHVTLTPRMNEAVKVGIQIQSDRFRDEAQAENDEFLKSIDENMQKIIKEQKPPNTDRDWNKTLPATHESIQPWISELAKHSDSRSSFNELMDTPVEFSNFLMNRLKVDSLIPELLAGPTYELMKGSCKSLGKLTNLTVEERFAFNVSLRMFTKSIVIQRRMEDLQLGVESYQNKLNLTKPDTYRSDLKRQEAYIAYSNPRGFIYQNKDKQNRLMQIN